MEDDPDEPPDEPLSHPTWLVIASSAITSAKYNRRGRDLDTKTVPTLSSSIAASNPPEPPDPSTGIIDAYITGGLRIVMCGFFEMVVERV